MDSKKRIITISVLAGVLVIIAIIIFLMNKTGGVKYKMYDKYSLAISIDLKVGDAIESHLIDVSFDGENGRIVSNNIDKDSYIIGERVYYLEDETFYWYRVDSSYLDVYELISSFNKIDFEKDVNESKQYMTVLDKDKVEDLLGALFIKGGTPSSIKAQYVVSDNYVEEFNMSIDEIGKYDEVNLHIGVTKLEDDYVVNTLRIFGSVGGGRRYKLEEATVNIFELGGSS